MACDDTLEPPKRMALRSFAALSGSSRSSFEEWISGPPYERETERWPQDETKHAWPGQYKDLAVQLAWEAWQQAQNVEFSGGILPSAGMMG